MKRSPLIALISIMSLLGSFAFAQESEAAQDPAEERMKFMIQGLFDQLDEDKDGSLSMDEYMNLVQRAPGRGGRGGAGAPGRGGEGGAGAPSGNETPTRDDSPDKADENGATSGSEDESSQSSQDPSDEMQKRAIERFKAIDSNEDQKISFDEMLANVKERMQNRPPPPSR